MKSNSTWSTPTLWNTSPKMIWINWRRFCPLTTRPFWSCPTVTSNSSHLATTQSATAVHSTPTGEETIVKATSSWVPIQWWLAVATRCNLLKLHQLKMLEVWQKIFHCLILKCPMWWKAPFQDIEKHTRFEEQLESQIRENERTKLP